MILNNEDNSLAERILEVDLTWTAVGDSDLYEAATPLNLTADCSALGYLDHTTHGRDANLLYIVTAVGAERVMRTVVVEHENMSGSMSEGDRVLIRKDRGVLTATQIPFHHCYCGISTLGTPCECSTSPHRSFRSPIIYTGEAHITSDSSVGCAGWSYGLSQTGMTDIEFMSGNLGLGYYEIFMKLCITVFIMILSVYDMFIKVIMSSYCLLSVS